MAYNPSIPEATDKISDSQSAIKENFTQIKALIDVNHVTFGASGEGAHKFVTFQSQGAAPTTSGTDINIYNAADAGVQQIYIKKASGTAIPITKSSQGGVSGWTYLPSGMKIVWGQDTILSPNPTKITLFSSVSGFPGFTTSALAIQLTRIHLNATSQNFIQLDSFNSTQLIARRSTSNTSENNIYTWLAIGL